MILKLMAQFTLVGLTLVFSLGCSSMKYNRTVDSVDLHKFMKRWYVIAGRVTSLEKGAHNATETYTWNEKEQRIDIDFKFNKDSFDGEVKSIPQKAWVENTKTNAHWKVQPFWPLKFNYLIIGLDSNYDWTVIGVPSGEYIWIMASVSHLSDGKLQEIIETVRKNGYPDQDIKLVPQQ